MEKEEERGLEVTEEKRAGERGEEKRKGIAPGVSRVPNESQA